MTPLFTCIKVIWFWHLFLRINGLVSPSLEQELIMWQPSCLVTYFLKMNGLIAWHTMVVYLEYNELSMLTKFLISPYKYLQILKFEIVVIFLTHNPEQAIFQQLLKEKRNNGFSAKAHENMFGLLHFPGMKKYCVFKFI